MQSANPAGAALLKGAIDQVCFAQVSAWSTACRVPGGGRDGDKQGGLAAARGPMPGPATGCRSSIQTAGRCPANRVIGGISVAGPERGRGHGDHRQGRDPQEGSQQAVGVIVPCGGPGDVKDVPELGDPLPVCQAQADRFFPGEQVVFGEPCRACHGAVGIEDPVDIEQQSGPRHLPSMDAACRGRAGPLADSTTASRIANMKELRPARRHQPANTSPDASRTRDGPRT